MKNLTGSGLLHTLDTTQPSQEPNLWGRYLKKEHRQEENEQPGETPTKYLNTNISWQILSACGVTEIFS